MASRDSSQTTAQNDKSRCSTTLAEKWYEQGIEQGIELGREKGREEGAARTLLGLLAHRFGPLDDGFIEQIHGLNLEQLQSLNLFTLDATSIDQVAEQVQRLRNGSSGNR